MSRALTPAAREQAIAARASKRGAHTLAPATRSTGGGGKFTPVSVGLHFFQFADVLDVTYAPSEYNEEGKAPRPRVMYVFAADEVDEDGITPKVIPYWTSTSIYNGDRKFQTGGLLKLIREVVGIPDLASSAVLERWGDEGQFDPQTPVYPFGPDGSPRPGWVFAAEVQHKQVESRSDDRTFVRAEIVPGSIRRVSAEEYAANARLADAYKRPLWVSKQEASTPPGTTAAGAPGIAPEADPLASAKPAQGVTMPADGPAPQPDDVPVTAMTADGVPEADEALPF